MTWYRHCDRAGCTSHARGSMARDWLDVRWGDRLLHFCCWDCLMKHAASYEPPTTIGFGRTA